MSDRDYANTLTPAKGRVPRLGNVPGHAAVGGELPLSLVLSNSTDKSYSPTGCQPQRNHPSDYGYPAAPFKPEGACTPPQQGRKALQL